MTADTTPTQPQHIASTLAVQTLRMACELHAKALQLRGLNAERPATTRAEVFDRCAAELVQNIFCETRHD